MSGILLRLKHALAEAASGWQAAPDPAWWAEPPARFGDALDDRYVIDGEIGRGGMAVVLLATDRRYDRRVALKVLRPDLADKRGRRRFLREIRLAAQLSHPHILPVYDSGEVADVLYFVMPVAEGGSLRTRLRQVHRLGLDEALQLLREVAGALDYAHRRRVVHRDIKPENILFHENVAMIADFGIGKVLWGHTGDMLTGDGAVMGTVPYMSPEQLNAEGRIDGRSDMYSLGCLLYEMLTGTPVFPGPNVGAVLARRLADPTPALAFPGDVPPAVQGAIRSLLAVTPAERPASGAELLRTLGHATTCGCPLCASRPQDT